MAKRTARKAHKKAAKKAVRKTSPRKAAAKKTKKKALRPQKKRSAPKKARTARLIGSVAGRFAWSVLVSVLSSETRLPANTFQLKDDLGKYGFYDVATKARLAQLLRARHVDIADEPIIGARTVGDVEKAITGKLPEKTS